MTNEQFIKWFLEVANQEYNGRSIDFTVEMMEAGLI